VRRNAGGAGHKRMVVGEEELKVKS